METNFENVRSIYPLNQSKSFTHEEALELVPLLMHISAKAKRDLNLLNSQLTFVRANSARAVEIQDKISGILQTWSDKVRRLGAVPISLCKVRIPSEEGHFLWEYPESRLFLH